MNARNVTSRLTGPLFLALLAVAAGCSKPADSGNAASTASSTAASTAASNGTDAKNASKLGDLSPFRVIATDVADMIDKGNLPGAKARVKDLEVAWDDAEAGLKSRTAADWHVLDKAIDDVINALRAANPNAAESKQASDRLMATLNRLEGKK
jgi:hypothetical protein